MDLSGLSDGSDDFSQRDEWSDSGREPIAQDVADDIEYERTEGAAKRAWEGDMEDVEDISDEVLFRDGRRRRARAEQPLTPLEIAQRNLENAQRQLIEEQERAERFGPEPRIGAVITFLHFYPGSRLPYTFAAVRTQRGWYVTGRETGRFTWVELNEKLVHPGTLYVATDWDASTDQAATPPQFDEPNFVRALTAADSSGVVEYYGCMADGDVHEVVKRDGAIISDRPTGTTTSYVRALRRADEMNTDLRNLRSRQADANTKDDSTQDEDQSDY